MKKSLFYIVMIILVIVSSVVFSKYEDYQDFKQNKIELKDEVTVNIEKGSNWKKVASSLKKAGVITDERSFYWMIREYKWGGSLKTGEFAFSGSINPVDVAKIIMSGKVKLYTFTIPEGYNKFDADSVFRKLDWVVDNDKFLKICSDKNFLATIEAKGKRSCEGLLFPSTYSFPNNTGILTIMEKMAAQMKLVLAKYQKELDDSKMDVYELLKMASVIEKETGVKSEQPMIASVFLNRTRIGMKIQSDPTVIYGMLPDNYKGNIRKQDLLNDHPWSTYTRYGLPVTPICFPGEGAIKSVLNPEKTSYLYFVATGKGYHYFSKNLVEHNAAVDYYQVKGLKGEFKY
ncbi:MAG TPA: endolytic transglycosylase MltG [bacterium]|nr:endolytic transglycosylase MltG [bacterium]HPS28736.1 endolytic transglycosylase MltG [bacterium]